MTVTEPGETVRSQQAEKARRHICRSVIACLDERGYSETSLGRVQKRAGISRGALTHHFPTRVDMMVATVEQILEPVRFSGKRRGRAFPQEATIRLHLVRLWTDTVNTVEGRALFEILVAARTDVELQVRIAPALRAYDEEVGEGLAVLYRSRGRGEEDVRQLWTICRIFLRGLHVQERFGGGQAETVALMERFAELITDQIERREENENAKPVRD